MAMISKSESSHQNEATITSTTRRLFILGVGIFMISACEARPMRANINISLFNYSNYEIFDVFMNGTDFGVAPAHGFNGSNAVMLGQSIVLGPQKITWRIAGPEGMPRNGETITAKNIPVITGFPAHAKWLALHIYDDDTVEIAFSKGDPDELNTARGRKIIEDWEKKHAK